jgi:hypothetical protein
MNKKTYILGVVFIILLGLFFAYEPFLNYRQNYGKPKNFFSSIKLSDIDKIEINRQGKIIVLEGHGNIWKIGGTKDFYVDTAALTALKNNLADAAKAKFEIISEKREKQTDFETTAEIGAQIKLSSGEKVLADFILGKNGNDYSSSYLSLPGGDITYIIKTALSIPDNNSGWYAKEIFKFDKEKINKIRFQYPDRQFSIEKINNVWEGVSPYKFKINNEKLTSTIDILSELQAVDIPKQNFSGTGLEKHPVIVQVVGDGIDSTIMLGGQDEEGRYFAKKGDSDNIYLVAETVKKELDKKINDLK